MFQRLGVGARVGAFSFMLVFLTGTLAGWLAFRAADQALIDQQLSDLGRQAQLRGARLVSGVEGLREDVHFLSHTPPVQGIIRSRLAGGIDPLDGSTEGLWRQRMASIFRGLLETHPNYSQVRFIGVADGGLEIVRVARNGARYIVAPTRRLQRKGDESYFRKAIVSDPQEIFLSEIELNREHGEVSIPHTPVLRAAAVTLEAGHEGRVFGVIVINMDVRSAFRAASVSIDKMVKLSVTNDQGDLLLHEDSTLSFGFDLGARHRIQDLYPELAPSRLPSRSAGGVSLRVRSEEGERFVFLLQVPFDPSRHERYLGVMLSVPQAVIAARTAPVRRHSMILVAALVTPAVVIALLLARRFTKPLDQITDAARRLSEGEGNLALPKHVGGEIGVLSRAFQEMAERIAARERSLRDLDARIFAIHESSADTIITCDETGRIETFNPAAERMFGHHAWEVLGSDISKLVPPSHQERHGGYIADYLRTGVSEILGKGRDVTALRKDGSLVSVHLSVDEAWVRGGRIFTATVRDISERKRVDAELERYRTELEERVEHRTRELAESQTRLSRSQRLAALGTLSAGFAHEINNPLGAILLASEAASRSLSRSGSVESAEGHLAMIRAESRRAGRIVRSVLSFSRMGTQKKWEAEIEEVIRAATASCQPAAARKDVRLDIGPIERTKLLINADEIHQVVGNLLTNAIDASELGGTVSLTANRRADSVRISVRDHGRGMTDEQLQRAFDPFFTTRLHDGGTGLGLSIAHRIVEEHGGVIELDSREGVGTTASVLLPVKEAPAEAGLDGGSATDC